MLKSGMLAAFAAVSPLSFGNGLLPSADEKVKPMLLPSLPPLADNGGMEIRVWMRSSMTNGMFSSVECAVAPKLMGPPPHLHKELDEIMYVLNGTASVLIGEEVVEINAGGWHLRPRKIKHTFWNASAEPLRFIDMYFNQPFEEYLEQIFHELTTENGYTDGSDKKNQALTDLNDKFGLVFSSDCMDERNAIMKKYDLK